MKKGVAVIDIGRVGLWTGVIDQHPTSRVREMVQELESIGWPCLWRPEASGRDAFVSCATMLEATTRLCVATGIAQIHARHPHTTRAGQKTLHESSGGRFLLGLGVSHAPFIEGSRGLPYRTPYSDMVSYLNAMESAPFTAVAAADEPPTVLAALGPKMLKLSATAAQGAHPYFATPEHTAYARSILGTGPLLAPEQMVVIDTDLSRARETAKVHMTRYLRLPNYTNNLLRLGFTEDDIAGPSNRLVDAVVACGPIDVAIERVAAQHAAGADHVAIQVLSTGADIPMHDWRDLAAAFDLRAAL
jgi:probable F420-dependent oxidoreductase